MPIASRAYEMAGTRQQQTGCALALIRALSYNRREGQDFYLVFNDGLNTERAASEPDLPLSAGRTLLLKYSHSMPFGW